MAKAKAAVRIGCGLVLAVLAGGAPVGAQEASRAAGGRAAPVEATPRAADDRPVLAAPAPPGARRRGGEAAGAAEADPSGGALTLEEALRMALERNRDLETARLELGSAEERVKEAWGSVWPTVDLSASYTRSLTVPAAFLPRVFVDPNASPDELVAIRFGADHSWALNVRAEQPLFQASAFLGVGAAGRYHTLQREVVRGAAQEVATRTRLAFYDVLLAQEAERLGENSVRRIRQTLEETRAMNRAGLASDYDVLRLEVELANVESGLRRARNSVAAARRTLGVELGLERVDSVAVAGSLAAFDLEEGAAEREKAAEQAEDAVLRLAGIREPEALAPEEAVRLARANRSDLRQLELMERLRRTELRLEQVEYLPKISLFGNYSINAQQNGAPEFFGAGPDERAYGRQVGVQVTLPIFGGFKRPARIEQRRAVVRQLETQRELAEARVENEVRTLLDQVREARQRAAAQRLAVEQATRGFEIAAAQYREGLSGQLEVTDAEVALRQSEFNYAEAVYDYLVARARLDAATGMVPLVDTDRKIALDR